MLNLIARLSFTIFDKLSPFKHFAILFFSSFLKQIRYKKML